MILVDTCETINESTIQVIFQLCVILATLHSKPITTLQILVVTISLLMASKGPAEDFLASKMRRLKRGKVNEGVGEKLIMKELRVKQENKDIFTDGEAVQAEEIQEEHVNEEVESRHLVTCFCLKTKIEDYHEMDFPEKLPMIGDFNHSCLKKRS